jgi:hypothetical protein
MEPETRRDARPVMRLPPFRVQSARDGRHAPQSTRRRETGEQGYPPGRRRESERNILLAQ